MFEFKIKGKVGHLYAYTKLRIEVNDSNVSIWESYSEVDKAARKLQSCSSITASTMENQEYTIT